jgi:peptidoglycan-N-acetylglucosamine deacetylase
LPFTWGLDDFPAFEFVTTRNGVIPGLHSPSQMYEIWAGDFDYLHDRLDEGVYILTLHPQCIGRGHRLLMLERLIDGVGFDGGERQVQDRWASSLLVAAWSAPGR